MRHWLPLSVIAFGLFLGGCEAMQKQKERREAEEKEQMEAQYEMLASVARAQHAAPVGGQEPCDDDAIEATKKGRYTRGRRRLPTVDLAFLDFLSTPGHTAPLSEWAQWRSKSLDDVPPRADVFDGDWKGARFQLNKFFDSRFVVVYQNTLSADQDAEGYFSGQLAVVDLEGQSQSCAVAFESDPSKARASGPRKGSPKYRIQDSFERDANKALKSISRHFTLR